MRGIFYFQNILCYNNAMIKKYFLQILTILLLLGIAWALFLLKKPISPEENDAVVPIQASIMQTEGDLIIREISPEYFPIRNWLIDEPEISAKAAIIFNLKNEKQKSSVLYQKNPNEKLPIASLTKIMTAIIATENLEMEEIIRVSRDSVFTDGDSGGLIIGEELTVKDLLYIMLIGSSNDAAMVMANDNSRMSYVEFVELMNKKSKELKLENTEFGDASGLSEKNQSTVTDMANLIKITLNFPVLSEILKTQKTTISSLDNKFVHSLINTNKLLGKIPAILGGKTGFTIEAGGCMATFFNIDNNYLISVVLGSKNREEDTEKLINWAQAAWIWK